MNFIGICCDVPLFIFNVAILAFIFLLLIHSAKFLSISFVFLKNQLSHWTCVLFSQFLFCSFPRVFLIYLYLLIWDMASCFSMTFRCIFFFCICVFSKFLNEASTTVSFPLKTAIVSHGPMKKRCVFIIIQFQDFKFPS